MSKAAQQTKSVLLFGDQTDSWNDGLDQVYKLAGSMPWLQEFLGGLTRTVNEETRAIVIDPFLQDSLGTFSSLHELGERYRNTTDELGMAHCLLLHTVRASNLLLWARRDASILSNNGNTEWLGISGGLISMSAWAVSEDFDTLRAALLEIARLLVRLCKFTSIKSRSVEDRRGVWGWAVVGVALEDLSKSLEEFQQSVGIPPLKRAKPGVTGAGWSTIIGPPSVLERFIHECPAMKRVAKNPLKIHALQHTIELTEADIDFIVGDNKSLLTRAIYATGSNLWGMDEPDATYTTWGDMLRAICAQVLSRGLDITKAIGKMTAALGAAETVRVIEMGTTSHTSYLLGTLEKAGKVITLEGERTLLQVEDTRQPASPVGRIAVVGVSGRGPMCGNINEFWDIIMSKTDTCTEVPKDRFDIDEFYSAEHGRGEKKCTTTTRYGCFMDKPGHFDSRFFHISPREAMLMDPCHRHFLMSTYEALEMAGYSDGKTKSTDPNRIATFYGQVTDDWHDQSHPTLGCDPYTLPGVQRAFGPGRVAWQFNWEGPTYALDSACASTTSCVHLACMSLQTGDIDMAVAGAGNILNYPHSFASLSKSGVLSDTGNCKTFRDDADGYCRGDFVGSVVLKRLEDAEADNDKILAVIAASGRNHSGNSPSITTSDAGAQERLFRKVLRNAHVSADDISYVEMHGTGTQVGDPAEIGAVGNLLKHKSRADGPVPVGGVKANFGHGEGAAGMASLMKCIKMFETNTIPPQAGMPHALNPKFPPLENLNVEILSQPKEFKRVGNTPRRILLNNFDAAGGNACMLLEEYMGRGHVAAVKAEAAADPRSSHVVVLSARTPAAHLENRRQLLTWLRANPDTKIEDVAYTTTARRMHHPIRFACTATSTSTLVAKLENDIADQDSSSWTSPSSHVPPVVFVFTGQGSHYAGMGCELYRTSASFREAVDLCARIGEQHGFPQFVNLIANAEADMASMTTTQTQLAVLALEVGLAAYWESVGVHPEMVMGHSLGEYAALYAAGVLSLADAIYLVGRRAGLLLDRCEADTFAMLSVSMSAAHVQAFLDSHPQYATCSISCINSTTGTVISGSADEIGNMQQDLAARSKALAVPYGFHSFQVDLILSDYKTIAAGVTFLAPRIPVASTLLGSIVDSQGTFDGQYLAQQTRQPVNFVQALSAVTGKLTDPVWIELGPSRVCTSFIKTTLSPATQRVMSTLEGPNSSTAWASVSKCMAAAYLLGIPIDWRAFHQLYERHLEMLTLPSYAWDMKDYWITFSEATGGSQEALSTQDRTAARQQMISTLAQYVVSESSSTGRTSVTLRAALAEPGLSAVIDGHRMQDLPILPGSAFCEAAFAAAAYALDANGKKTDASVTKLSLRSPSLKRPLTKSLVGSDGELVTTATLKEASNDIQVSWKATSASKGPTYELGSCSLTIRPDVEGLQASWDRTSYFVKARMDEIIRSATEGRGHRFQPDIFYALFAPTVQYDSGFKSIKEAFISSDFSEAAAEIVLKDHPVGTRFVASPYWGESVTHLAGFAVNANPLNLKTAAESCFINSGFDSFEQTVPFEAGKVYLTYVRVLEKDVENKICDVFVFDNNKLIAQCSGLNFHIISNATLRKALGGTPRTPGPVTQSAPKTSPQMVAEKEAAPAANVEIEPEERKQPTGTPDSRHGVFDIIVQTIAVETGVDLPELTDDTVLADIGIDSIMSIEIASKVSETSGLELAPSFLIENVVIGDLRRQFAVAPSLTPSADSDSPSESSWDSRPETSLSFREEPELIRTERSTDVSVDAAAAEAPKNGPQPVGARPTSEIDDSSPPPNVKITLLQGAGRSRGPNPKQPPPFYMIADGTGTIATYIHLPAAIKSKVAIYGIDSPYLHCPARLTPDVGISGAAKLIVEALLKKQPANIPFWIGGFSGGAMMAYEVCRQLSGAGRSVSGLLLIDMCAPRLSSVHNDNEIGLAMFDAVSGQDDSGVWRGTDNTRLHLQALFASVAVYNPPPLEKGEEPPARRTALIWAEKGMIDRCTHSERFNQLAKERNIATTAYPGFMEDPKLGAVMWSLPHKTGADLGSNGWYKFVGGEQLMCMSVGADHLQMAAPSHVSFLGEQMDRAFDFFQDD